MNGERRRYQRSDRPLDGLWQGASGKGQCRIGDLGVGGCFVQTLAVPVVGETTVITVKSGDRELSLRGNVRYVEPGIGFAVQFQNIPADVNEELERLVTLMGQPKS